MSRLRFFVMTLLAVVAASGLASASASATTPEWFVSGAKLGGGFEELAKTTTVTENFKLLYHAKEIEVECKKISFKETSSKVGTLIENSKAVSSDSIKFEECELKKPSLNCKLQSAEIATGAVGGVLEGTTAANAFVKFAPRAPSTEFAKFKLEGTGCGVLSGSYIVKGFTQTSAISAPGTEQKEHVLSFNEANPGNLKVGGEAVEEFKGKVGVTLKSTHNWSIG